MKRKKMEPKYSLEHVEKLHVFHVLSLFGGNKTHTAEALGIGLRTLQRKLQKWDAEASSSQEEANAIPT
jgi:DNA-binding NtrC family response regulator